MDIKDADHNTCLELAATDEVRAYLEKEQTERRKFLRLMGILPPEDPKPVEPVKRLDRAAFLASLESKPKAASSMKECPF